MDSKKTKKLVLTGLFFAIAIVLSIIENMLPSVPVPVPGVKFGLSNIAVMYALFFLSKSQAYLIAVLKSVFVVATRGVVAAVLSLSGGILSLTVMLLLILIFAEAVSFTVLSILGAVTHNVGQFAVISVIYKGLSLWSYVPVLILSGVAAGIVTAILLKFLLPAFKRLSVQE